MTNRQILERSYDIFSLQFNTKGNMNYRLKYIDIWSDINEKAKGFSKRR